MYLDGRERLCSLVQVARIAGSAAPAATSIAATQTILPGSLRSLEIATTRHLDNAISAEQAITPAPAPAAVCCLSAGATFGAAAFRCCRSRSVPSSTLRHTLPVPLAGMAFGWGPTPCLTLCRFLCCLFDELEIRYAAVRSIGCGLPLFLTSELAKAFPGIVLPFLDRVGSNVGFRSAGKLPGSARHNRIPAPHASIVTHRSQLKSVL